MKGIPINSQYEIKDGTIYRDGYDEGSFNETNVLNLLRHKEDALDRFLHDNYALCVEIGRLEYQLKALRDGKVINPERGPYATELLGKTDE